MGDLVQMPHFKRFGTLREDDQPCQIVILPVVRVERCPDDPYITEVTEPLRLTLAERRALGARWGLDENGRPLK